jgi:hypothetical protein
VRRTTSLGVFTISLFAVGGCPDKNTVSGPSGDRHTGSHCDTDANLSNADRNDFFSNRFVNSFYLPVLIWKLTFLANFMTVLLFPVASIPPRALSVMTRLQHLASVERICGPGSGVPASEPRLSAQDAR